ncbi:hypothetical protein L6164_021604 [Bauhinia variegata]|uniref:Uncharacterized protein n=1 Tax=Bauhinia variegata TaxID=167791 RepID=A0ACB9N0H3_BAUVA|nr:hypothetical protein L6164_021604 [Bauhinia variegata]
MGRRPPLPPGVESGHHYHHHKHKHRPSQPPPPLPNWGPPSPRPMTPWLVPLILLVNIASFWYSMLEKLGGLEKALVVEQNEAWLLFSCRFLHAGVIHLLANMFSLLFVGIRMEEEFGFLRIGLLYLLSGLGGSLLSLLHLKGSAKATISVGASGALFGCLGAMLSKLLTNWTIYANKL